MFFTQEDYRKIEKWLLANSRKDTDFVGAATPLKGNETVVLVQDGKNVKTSVKDIVDQFFLLGVSDFLNITDKYGESYISLDQAIQLIPFRSRKEGQVITFLNTDGNWEIYQFIGKLNQWNNPTLWNNPLDWEKFIIDSILPDEEDLTKSLPDENGNSYLSLKDREYNPEDFSGLGRVILRKNIVEVEDPIYGKVKKNILTQLMVNQANTIYEIRYDFDLNGAELTIPIGCIMKFDGGSLTNGTLKGNDTLICGRLSDIFDNVVLKGSYKNKECDLIWWGVKTSIGFDNSSKIQNAFDSTIGTIKVGGKYYLSYPVMVTINKFVIGSTGFLYNSTGFLANDDFSPRVIDFEEKSNKPAFSQEVYGMFYHRDGHATMFQNIFIDARYKAKFCIEHIDLYGTINMRFVGLFNATFVGLLQYACEAPVFEDVYIRGCRIGAFISSVKFNEQNPLDFTGSLMGSDNLVNISRMRVMGGNYGVIIKGCSNFSMNDCETAYNAVFGTYISSSSGIMSNYYTEGDCNCNFWIDENGNKIENSRGTTLQYLIDNNLDGLPSMKVNKFNATAYWRGPIVISKSRVAVISPFISIKPRSYEDANCIDIQEPTERNAGGIDAYLLTFSSAVIIESPRYYISTSNTASLPKYGIVDVLENSTNDISLIEYWGGPDRQPIFFIAGVSSRGFNNNELFSIQEHTKLFGFINRGKNIFKDFNTNVLNARYSTNKNYNIIQQQFIKYYNNIPLFNIIDTTRARRSIYYDNNEVSKIFGTANQAKAVFYVEALEDIENIKIQFQAFFRNDSTYIAGNALDPGNPRSLKKGIYKYVVYIDLAIQQEWNSLEIAFTSTDYSNILMSDIYFYEVDDWIMNTPKYSILVSTNGTYANKPSEPPISFQYYCIDKQTTEGQTNGIMIYHKGNDVWVDALGRVVS